MIRGLIGVGALIHEEVASIHVGSYVEKDGWYILSSFLHLIWPTSWISGHGQS